jgi:hypothetical protein
LLKEQESKAIKKFFLGKNSTASPSSLWGCSKNAEAKKRMNSI